MPINPMGKPIIGIIALVIWLAGCNSLPIRGFEETGGTATYIPTVISTSTRIVLKENSATPSPTKKPTLTPSWTPRPTLELDKAIRLVEELQETNKGCQFPCWWGITPGVSKWDETEVYFRTFAFRIDPEWKTRPSDKTILNFVYFPIDENPTLINSLPVGIEVDKESGIVMNINPGQIYFLPKIIETYGIPNEIWMWASGIPITGPAAYSIKIIYTDRAMTYFIAGNAKLNHNQNIDILTICNDKLAKDAGGMDFWAADYYEELQSVIDLSKYYPFEEVTKVTKAEFAEMFLSDKVSCLEIPLKDGDIIIIPEGNGN